MLDRADRRLINGFLVRSDSGREAFARTDAAGTFGIDFGGAGRCSIRVKADGLAAAELGPVELDGDRGFDAGTIWLTEGGVLEGRVLVDADRSPAEVIVGISRGDGFAKTQRVRADGRFRFERLTPGRWLVTECPADILPPEHATRATVEDDPWLTDLSGVDEIPWSAKVSRAA